MAYREKLYVATVSGGVYYTADFTGSGDHPTWTSVNGGLASLAMSGLQLDANNPAGHQYALAAGVLYERIGGDWTEILSVAQSRALANNSVRGSITSFVIDPITGYIHCFFDPGAYTRSNGTACWPYCLTSTDGGDSWDAVNLDTDGYYYWTRAAGSNIDAYNGVVIACRQKFNTVECLYYSSDGGKTFTTLRPTGGSSIYTPNCWLNRNTQATAYMSSFGSGELFDLLAVTLETGAEEYLQEARDIAPYETYDFGFWSDPDDAGKMASLAHQTLTKLWRTTDGWANVVDESQGNTDANDIRVICQQSAYGEWIVGRGNTGTGCLRTTADGVTTVDRSGASNTSSPYTDSIPETCGGIVTIQAVVEEATEGPTPPDGGTITPPDTGTPVTLGGGAYVQAVTMPDYTGDERGEPLPGDRGAWAVDSEAHAQLHASDIAHEASRYHLPLWDAAAGEAPVFNGISWQPQDIATQAELNDHAADPAAHHDPVTLAVGSDSALTLNNQELTLADVLTPTEHTAIGDSAPHHAAVTLGAGNDADMATLAAQELTVVLKDHDHSGDSGDGGQITVAAIDSEAATSGQVATADGAGGTAWQTVAAPSGEVLMQDGVTAPPVPIETEAQDDWLYEG